MVNRQMDVKKGDWAKHKEQNCAGEKSEPVASPTSPYSRASNMRVHILKVWNHIGQSLCSYFPFGIRLCHWASATSQKSVKDKCRETGKLGYE